MRNLDTLLDRPLCVKGISQVSLQGNQGMHAYLLELVK
jgi:hypothetical protein